MVPRTKLEKGKDKAKNFLLKKQTVSRYFQKKVNIHKWTLRIEVKGEM